MAVLAHLLLFAPASAFPRLSACALSMAAAALQKQGEEGIYLAAAVVVSTSQRLQKLGPEEEPQPKLEDLECVAQLERPWAWSFWPFSKSAGDLGAAADQARDAGNLSFFVYSRVLAASEHVNRAKEHCKRLFVSSF